MVNSCLSLLSVRPATKSWGQGGSLTSGIDNWPSGVPSAVSLSGVSGITFSPTDDLYAADFNNNRVLFYPSGSTTASIVYGQPDFTTVSPATTQNKMSNPMDVALDSNGMIYVSDTNNNRVLVFQPANPNAVTVYGQSDFVSNAGGIGVNGFQNPHGVAIDKSDNLYVCDSSNNRVLIFPSGSTTATSVIGQADFTSNQANRGGPPGPNTLNRPQGIVLDDEDNVYIADNQNNRILFFPKGSSVATRVYAQAGSFVNTVGANGISNLSGPRMLALDITQNLYVCDLGNHRVMVFSPNNYNSAIQVFGQPDFSGFTINAGQGAVVNADGFNQPNGVAFDSSANLYVSDDNNDRILQFGQTTIINTDVSVITSFDSDVLILENTSVTFSADVIINGTLTAAGSLTIGPNVYVSVTKQITIYEDLSISSGGNIVTSSTFFIDPNATVTPIVTSDPGNVQSVTLTIAQYSFRSGSFGAINDAIKSFPNSDCVDLGTPTLQSTRTTLSTIMSVTRTCKGGSSPSIEIDGLSPGIIGGIVVGIIALGTCLAIGIVLVSKRLRNQLTERMNSDLKGKDMEGLSSVKVQRDNYRRNDLYESGGTSGHNWERSSLSGLGDKSVPLSQGDTDQTSGVIPPGGCTGN